MPSTYLRLTQALVDRYKAGDPIVKPNTFIRCAAIPGFGMHVQSTKSSFFVEGSVGRGGRNIRVVIGAVGKLPLDKAIAQAKKKISELAEGVDPVKALRAEHAASKVDKLTLREALSDLEGSRRIRASTLNDYTKAIKSLGWLDTRIVDLVDKVGPAYGDRVETPTSAARIMRSLRSVWNFARGKHPTLPPFPSVELKKIRKRWATAPRKQRVIPDALLPKWRKQVAALDREDVRDFILTLHLTGMRPIEARALTVEHVHLEAGSFFVADPKNHNPVDLPIVSQLAPIMRRRSKLVGKGALFPFGDVRKSHSTVNAAPWTYYDLRRQFITAAHRCGIDDLIARRLTNHVVPDDDSHAGYVVLNADALRPHAQRVADWLDALGKPPTKTRREKPTTTRRK
jgi:integrase